MDSSLLLEQLRESQLLTEADLTGLSLGQSAQEPSLILSSLIEKGRLTKYQAKQLWEGRGTRLALGQYRILDELGRGGCGCVYKALHMMMNRLVAIKVVAPELVEDTQARTWFRREVMAVTELHHPNLVMAYDANEVEGLLFLVMEYVDGPNLHVLVQTEGPLPIPLACEIMAQAAQGLQYAHEKGMVHRDIKPANLLIPRQAFTPAASKTVSTEKTVFAKIADFGLARLQRSNADGTLMLKSEKSFAGTPDFVSPEQARDVHSVDIRSDLYSLGCTFYFALTGQRPFRGATPLEIVIKHLQEAPPPVEQIRPDLPPRLVRIVHRLLEKQPGNRYQTPAEFIQDLEKFVAEFTNRDAISPSTPTPVPFIMRPPETPANRLAATPEQGETPRPALAEGATACVPDLFFWKGPRLSPSPGSPPIASKAVEPPLAPELKQDPSALLPTMAVADFSAAEKPLADSSKAVEEKPSPSESSSSIKADTPETTPAAEAAPETPIPLEPAFKKAWKQWVTVISSFAVGSRQRVNETLYRELYQQLLAACRSHIGKASGNQKDLLQRLETLIEPWLSAQTLAMTDRETLHSLLRRCLQLEHQLGWAARSGSLWTWLLGAVLLAAAVFLGFYFSRI